MWIRPPREGDTCQGLKDEKERVSYHKHLYLCCAICFLLTSCSRLSGKESACQCRRCGFDPWVGKIPWRRERQPTPVFLSGKSHAQRSLVGSSRWDHRELDMTYQLNNNKPSGLCLTSFAALST